MPSLYKKYNRNNNSIQIKRIIYTSGTIISKHIKTKQYHYTRKRQKRHITSNQKSGMSSTIVTTIYNPVLRQVEIFTSGVYTSTLERYDVVIVFIILATLNKAVNLHTADCAGAYGSRRENPITFVPRAPPPDSPHPAAHPSPAFNGIKNQFPAQITQSRQIANASSL